MSQKKRPGIVRIKIELQDIRNDKSYNSIEILEEHPDFHSATFGFAGPMDSPYEGYWFKIFVEWPPEYPWKAPKFTLLDKIWNPYVDYDKGYICADILETEVSPALTTQKYILSIASLISQTKVKGDHSGFLNPQAASQMMTNYYEFSQQAKKLCKIHAYKKKNIYKKIKRGKPEKHEVKASGRDFKKIVQEESKDPKMMKKGKRIRKTRWQRARQLRRMREHLP